MKAIRSKVAVMAGVGLAMVPAIGHAAIATFSYDVVQISTTSTFTNATTTTVVPVGNAITVPLGDYFRFAEAVSVTGNLNPASGGAYETSGGLTQPVQLGLNSFQALISDSAPTVAFPVSGTKNSTSGTTNSTAKLNALFDVKSLGNVDMTNGTIGDVANNQLSGGVLAGNVDASSDVSKLEIGTGVTPSDVFTGLAYSTLSAGTVTISTTLPTSNIAFVDNTFVGDAAGDPPTYGTRAYTTGDVVNAPASLTVVVAAVPEPASLSLLGLGGLAALKRRRTV